MTAALGCFDMERHERDSSSHFFHHFSVSGKGIPLLPLFPATPHASHQPSQALLPPLPQPARICPLRATPRGPFYARLAASSHSPCFPCCFHFICRCQKFIRRDQGVAGEGKTGLGLKRCKRSEERGGEVVSVLVWFGSGSSVYVKRFWQGRRRAASDKL